MSNYCVLHLTRDHPVRVLQSAISSRITVSKLSISTNTIFLKLRCFFFSFIFCKLSIAHLSFLDDNWKRLCVHVATPHYRRKEGVTIHEERERAHLQGALGQPRRSVGDAPPPVSAIRSEAHVVAVFVVFVLFVVFVRRIISYSRRISKIFTCPKRPNFKLRQKCMFVCL